MHRSATHVVQETVLQVKHGVNHEDPHEVPGKRQRDLFHDEHTGTRDEYEKEENEANDGKVVEQDAVVATQGTEQTLGGKGSGHGGFIYLARENFCLNPL